MVGVASAAYRDHMMHRVCVVVPAKNNNNNNNNNTNNNNKQQGLGSSVCFVCRGSTNLVSVVHNPSVR